MATRFTSGKFWAYMGLLAVLAALPWTLKGNYYIYLAIMVGIYVILVTSLNLVIGYTGQISLAHGAFYGIGAYTCSILQVRDVLTFWPALLVAVIFTGVLGALVGLPMLRARGPYFAIGTMCLSIITALVLLNWQGLTGGTSLGGIPGPGQPTIAGVKIDFYSNKVYYYLVLIVAIFTILAVHRIVHSRVGRAFMAIREEEELAEAIGVNPMRYKVLSFSMGALIAALAGGLYSGYMGAIDPEIASVGMSFNLLVMVLVGGAGTISGAVVGTILLWMLPEVLQAAEEYKPLIFGLILLVIIIFMPRGIMGKVRAIHPRIAEWIP